MDRKRLADYLEATQLHPVTTQDDISTLCRQAIDHEFIGICIPPYYTALAVRQLDGQHARVITVIGFPQGYHTVNIKAEEAKKAVSDGADELDMVVNLAALKSGHWEKVATDVQNISTICHQYDRLLKVIVETSLLNEPELEKVCHLCKDAEVDYVKTSTGYQGGATVHAVQQLRKFLPSKTGIKASGGIKTAEQAWALIDAGATRIGTSSALQMIDA